MQPRRWRTRGCREKRTLTRAGHFAISRNDGQTLCHLASHDLNQSVLQSGGYPRSPRDGCFYGHGPDTRVSFLCRTSSEFPVGFRNVRLANAAATIGLIAIPAGGLLIAGTLDIYIDAMMPALKMTTAITCGLCGLPFWSGFCAALPQCGTCRNGQWPAGHASLSAVTVCDFGHLFVAGSVGAVSN